MANFERQECIEAAASAQMIFDDLLTLRTGYDKAGFDHAQMEVLKLGTKDVKVYTVWKDGVEIPLEPTTDQCKSIKGDSLKEAIARYDAVITAPVETLIPMEIGVSQELALSTA